MKTIEQSIKTMEKPTKTMENTMNTMETWIQTMEHSMTIETCDQAYAPLHIQLQLVPWAAA